MNTNKNLLCFSKNMGARDISSTLSLLGFSVTSNLGKYLGVPLHHSRVSTNMFQEIIDKVEKRLSGWNTSHLSLAGRITLAQSVLHAILVYIMQIFSLLNGVRGRIDRACRRFIWSGSSPQQMLSMVSWHNMCKPKAIGGLGFKSLAIMNQALHIKLAWGIISSPNSLWVKVLTTKYRIDPLKLPHKLPTRYGSHLWKSLGHVWSEVLARRRWCLGDSQYVRFWWDLWVTNNVPLMAYATNVIPVEILECEVTDFIDVNESWYWSRFEQYFPSNIILRIMALHPPSYVKGMDTIF